MTLSDLAAIGSFLSSLAVCGSLIYLAVQVRQSDRNQRTLLQQGTSTRNAQSASKLSEPHIAEIYARILHGESDFTTAEVVQLVTVIRAGLLGFQDQFLLRKLSLIDAVQLDSQERAYRTLLSRPVTRALWNSSRPLFAPEFVNYVDALLKDVPFAAPTDLGLQLKTDAAGLKAAEGSA